MKASLSPYEYVISIVLFTLFGLLSSYSILSPSEFNSSSAYSTSYYVKAWICDQGVVRFGNESSNFKALAVKRFLSMHNKGVTWLNSIKPRPGMISSDKDLRFSVVESIVSSYIKYPDFNRVELKVFNTTWSDISRSSRSRIFYRLKLRDGFASA